MTENHTYTLTLTHMPAQRASTHRERGALGDIETVRQRVVFVYSVHFSTYKEALSPPIEIEEYLVI